MIRTIALLAVLGLASTAAAAPKTIAKDARLWAAAETARPEQLKLLQQAVDIDSGTGDVAGGRKVAALFAERLRALGATVEPVPAEAPGLPENLVATLKGTGKARILLIGHMDTVFEPGTAARRPFRTDAEKGYGPGVGDEKGGVVEAITALKLLQGAGFKSFGLIVLLIETSEERGSTGTQGLIGRLAGDADVELNLEPGDTPDVMTVWRKSAATFKIVVTGRAAHAGMAPQEGRNAATELIHQLDLFEGAFPKSGEQTTANLTILAAGTRPNIIPDHAEAQINVRVRDLKDLEAIQAVLEKNAARTSVPDTTVSIGRGTDAVFPPLKVNPATEALADRAEAIYAGLGLNIARGGNGGASESALASAAGTPALDGLGPAGGGFHGENEYILLSTVTPRLYLLTRLIMDLGRSPPAPARSSP